MEKINYYISKNEYETIYIISNYINDSISDLLIFSRSFNYYIGYINFYDINKDLEIKEDEILYSALNKLLALDNCVYITNEDIKRNSNTTLIIKRNFDNTITIKFLPRKMFNSTLISNPEIKERMTLLFEELEESINQMHNNKKEIIYNYKLKK